MAEFDLFFGGVGEWMTFGKIGVNQAIEVDLRIVGKPMIAAIVEQQSIGDSGGGLGAGPDVKSGLRHRGDTHPLPRDVTVSNNEQGPRAPVKCAVLPPHEVQLLRIDSRELPHLFVILAAPPSACGFGRRIIGSRGLLSVSVTSLSQRASRSPYPWKGEEQKRDKVNNVPHEPLP